MSVRTKLVDKHIVKQVMRDMSENLLSQEKKSL